jgi:uncharacterized protein YjbK
MENKLTPEQEKEMADKISALVKERAELDLKRGNGVSLDKNEYIGERQAEIEEELKQLKKPKDGSK